jgi:RNA-binding protein YlmH
MEKAIMSGKYNTSKYQLVQILPHENKEGQTLLTFLNTEYDKKFVDADTQKQSYRHPVSFKILLIPL